MQWIRSAIFAENDIDDLLNLACFYGIIRSANFDGVYQDCELEQHVANRVSNHALLKSPQLSEQLNGTVLIASELYDSGGHSRVVLNWMRAFQEEGDHRLIITRKVAKGIEASLAEFSYHLCARKGIEQVNEILMLCADAQRVVLHIHPDDIVSATAAYLLARSGKTILFYNHADHVFTYGMGSAAAVCEVSSYGIALNRRTQRAKRSCYLGIPIKTAGVRGFPEPNRESQRTKIILSCGSSYKFAPAHLWFGDFIDRVLEKVPDAIVILVGPTGKESWWKSGINNWGDRVRFLGVLPHARYLEVMSTADVYIDSFPITGGTAFPEALMNGKNVAGISNAMQGYTPADELRVNSIEALTDTVSDLLNQRALAITQVEHARLAADAIHSFESFKNRLTAIYRDRCEGCPWEQTVPVDTYWIEKEWSRRKEVFRLDNTLAFELSPGLFWRLLLQTYKLNKRSRSARAIFATNRVLLRALPRPVRNYLIELRDSAENNARP